MNRMKQNNFFNKRIAEEERKYHLLNQMKLHQEYMMELSFGGNHDLFKPPM